jgi:hypothetical protein
MRSRVSTIAIALMLLVAAIPAANRADATTVPFTDISTSHFRADIEWLYAHGVTHGCAADLYCPGRLVTRGQMASFMVRLFDLPQTSRDFFTDDTASIHEANINRLAASGITSGCAASKFCPDGHVSRAQMASLLARAMALSAGATTNYFDDDDASPHEANINRVARAGISSGCATRRFCPSASINRGQMAAFLHRVVDPISPRLSVEAAPTLADAAPTRPAPVDEVVGYGRTTVGGDDGALVTVTSLAQLRAELKKDGPKNLRLSGSGVWDLGGSDLAIKKPNVTIDGSHADIVFKRGSVKITTSQVILRYVKSRSGDEAPVNGADVDSITINGNRGARDHIVLDHVEAIWGPDVSATMLGRVTDVTIQYSIFGEGLLHSSHPESHDADGHSLTFNISDDVSASAYAERVTLYGNLFTTSQSRSPRVIGCKACDLIDNVFYNYAEGPQGNPQSLNLIGNTWKKGPAPAAAGIPFTALLWRYQPDADVFDTRLDGRVYISDGQYWGFTPAAPRGDDAAVLASDPLVSPSVASVGHAKAYQNVLAEAGARLPEMDATTQRLIANVQDGTGVYFDGAGYAAPNPRWP